MLIERVVIDGFRNFSHADISLGKGSLLIGANDSGKTNFLYALRLLFDPSFGLDRLELDDADFNIGSNASAVGITVFMVNVVEDCLVSIFEDLRSPDGRVVLRYECDRGGDFRILAGMDDCSLEVQQRGRFYLRHLQMEYVGGVRDAMGFLKRRQAVMLREAMDRRDDGQREEDDEAIKDIQASLEDLNGRIGKLHYIEDSLDLVNEEMESISRLGGEYKTRLIAGNTDADALLKNLKMGYVQDGKPLVFGGDGRSNQLFFATWISGYKGIAKREKVVFYAIEEPEAHLHPQQQRYLAKYLSESIHEQVLVSTHSPQIVGDSSFGSVVRFVPDAAGTVMSGPQIGDSLESLGYRLSALSSETFFSDAVLLVEGPSERILYSAAAEALGIDLDYFNLSVLSVDGIGFVPYVMCCERLGIPWALRTDNDIFKIKGNEKWRFAGVERAIGIASELQLSDISELVEPLRDELRWTGGENPPEAALEAHQKIKEALEKHGIFLATRDLEADLTESPVGEQLMKFYSINDANLLYKKITERKAENMNSFVRAPETELRALKGDPIVDPLTYLLVSAGADNA